MNGPINRRPAGTPVGGQFAPTSRPESSLALEDAPVADTVTDAQLDELRAHLASLGLVVDREEAPEGAYAVDFNNVFVGDPYINGTGWFPDRETAETAASLVLPRINALAVGYLASHPEIGESYTDPEGEATRSWAYVVSLEDADGGRDGQPAYEEMYEGDEWLVASLDLGMLDADQRRRIEKLRSFEASLHPETPAAARPEVPELPERSINDYLTAALWSGLDDDDEPLDTNYGPEDIDAETRDSIETELKDFWRKASEEGLLTHWTPEQFAHDFALTRNHHGTGFWDRGHGNPDWEAAGRRLTEMADAYGELNLYVGDDGKLYR